MARRLGVFWWLGDWASSGGWESGRLLVFGELFVFLWLGTNCLLVAGRLDVFWWLGVRVYSGGWGTVRLLVARNVWLGNVCLLFIFVGWETGLLKLARGLFVDWWLGTVQVWSFTINQFILFSCIMAKPSLTIAMNHEA